MDRLSYFTRISYTRMKSYQIQCHEQSQQSGVHLHLLLNIVYRANSPKIFCQISTASFLKLRHTIKKDVIHMSMIHFYPVHQNAVFVLNVKMPFMSLFMSPLKLLFLYDGRTCFAKFKIYKGFVTMFQTSAFGRINFVYSWGNFYFQIKAFKFILNTHNCLILYFKRSNESHHLCAPREFRKTSMWPSVPLNTLSSHSG